MINIPNNNNNSINDSKHEQTRKKFKILALIFFPLGAVLFITGLINFFMSMYSGTMPVLFWCAFLGIIFLGIGGTCARFGFMRQVTTYVASQTAPVAKDTINYMSTNTADSLAHTASTISNAINNNNQIKCSNCGALNDKEAKFCKNCGKQLTKICPNCHASNDSNATYCDNCGTRL